MTNELLLLHRRGPKRFETANGFSFQTCMRHIVLGDSEGLSGAVTQVGFDDEVHRGEDAYRFLLQVICGLHSPLIGETEVYGQFKNAVADFKSADLSMSPQLARFFRSLFEDAKRIRQAHLIDLGSQSYGSILRRDLKGVKRVHILGAGHLVQEILPWIAKDGCEIQIHCRSLAKARAELGEFVNKVQLHEISDSPVRLDGAVIVAAPVSADWLSTWLGSSKPSVIADLRSDSMHDRVVVLNARIVALDEMLERVSKNQELLQARKRDALSAIENATLERARAVEYRPFGWDDVCA